MRVFSSSLSKVLAGLAVGGMALASVTAAQSQELKKINVLLANERTTSLYAAFAARELGFYEAEGLDVNLLSSATTVPYIAFLSNGDADLVMLDSAQVYQALNTQQPISVLYEAMQFAPEGIAVPYDSKIQGLRDLKGVTVGLASERDQVTTMVALGSVGMSIDDVSTVVVGDSGPVVVSAFRANQIDAYAAGSNDRFAMEAAGIPFRDITPSEVSENPGNSFVAWNPNKEEKRDIITRFMRAWAMATHAGIIDTKMMAAICKKNVPEQWEDMNVGMRLMNYAVYTTNVQRTRLRGSPQPDVWQRVQQPLIDLGELNAAADPSTFIDASFIEEVNNYTDEQVKQAIAKWKEANKDLLIQ